METEEYDEGWSNGFAEGCRVQDAALAASAARIETLTEACKSAQRQIELDNHNSAWVILNRAALTSEDRG